MLLPAGTDSPTRIAESRCKSIKYAAWIKQLYQFMNAAPVKLLLFNR